jgi:hypothetical protein
MGVGWVWDEEGEAGLWADTVSCSGLLCYRMTNSSDYLLPLQAIYESFQRASY